jgi:16S rRNA (guanine966-N2)-methyltransferase
MRRQERTLRIIAGRWRGRRFRFPAAGIRPTPDRVRETLFNWLQLRTEGARCLDLYAGSGALGLEALSRGAAAVTFVEQQRPVAEALRALLREWEAAGAQVFCTEAQAFLNRDVAGSGAAGEARRERFDLVFLDPPYAAGRAGELQAALSLLAQGWLRTDARIYVEQAKSDPPLDPADWVPGGAFSALRTGVAGEVRYHLLAAATATGVESE